MREDFGNGVFLSFYSLIPNLKILNRTINILILHFKLYTNK